MDELLIARAMFGSTLAFHIVFATLGIGMALLMVVAEATHLRTRDPGWRELARRWGHGTGVLFAIGAVSGTVVAVELGLLWPGFMREAGPTIGLAFTIEVVFFFLEAIFLAVYLYGWERVPARVHFLSGLAVAAAALGSGALITSVNAWMNTPTGFSIVAGKMVPADPWAAILNPSTPHEVVHMAMAVYAATAFLVIGIHAYLLLRGHNPDLHHRVLRIGAVVAVVACVGLVVTGDFAATQVAELQPVKFAAMEGHYETRSCAPLLIGGIPDDGDDITHLAFEVPCLLSWLAGRSVDTEVVGLEEVPAAERPTTPLVHWAFDIMVLGGVILVAGTAFLAWRWWRRRGLPDDRLSLWSMVVMGPIGMLAMEAGWLVTEFGRQPWTIHGVQRTSAALTEVQGLLVPFLVFSGIYLLLTVVTLILLIRLMRQAEDDGCCAYPGAGGAGGWGG